MEGMDMDPGKTQRPVYKRDEPRLRLEDSNSSSSEGEVFEPYLLAQGKKQTAEDYALKFLERNAGISREGAQYAIDYHKGKNTFVPRTLLKKVVPIIGETTYTIFCHSGSPKSYHLPPLGRIYVDDINFNTLIPDGQCLLMLRDKVKAFGSIQKWIIHTRNNICNGLMRLYQKKGYYNDRYLAGAGDEWISGVYTCGSDIPIINFDDPSLMVAHMSPKGFYNLSDIIMEIKSYHLKSPEALNRIKIVGAFCCGGVSNEGDALAPLFEDVKLEDADVNFQTLMKDAKLDYDDPLKFMNEMKSKGKIRQTKGKKSKKKGTTQKSKKKGTTKKSGKKGTTKKSDKKGSTKKSGKKGVGGPKKTIGKKK